MSKPKVINSKKLVAFFLKRGKAKECSWKIYLIPKRFSLTMKTSRESLVYHQGAVRDAKGGMPT